MTRACAGVGLLHKVGVNGGGQHPENAQRKSLLLVACVGLPHWSSLYHICICAEEVEGSSFVLI